MEIIFILSGLVSFVSLICFFILVANVSSIKKKLTPNNNQLFWDFNKAQAFNDYDEARRLLKELVWNDILEINKGFIGDESRKSRYETLKNKWAESLDKYKVDFPDKDIAVRC